MPRIKQLDYKLRHQYACQKSKAKHRGIEFHLTYDEWLQLWISSGHLQDRGCHKGSYVMSRLKDQGPYAIGNVIIQSKYANDTEPQVIKKISTTKRGILA
jgi:hypothetical protein